MWESCVVGAVEDVLGELCGLWPRRVGSCVWGGSLMCEDVCGELCGEELWWGAVVGNCGGSNPGESCVGEVYVQGCVSETVGVELFGCVCRAV